MTVVTTGDLATARQRHVQFLLGNGLILAAGGLGSGSTYLSSCELYDPDAGTWSAADSLNTGRDFAQGALLDSGEVLIISGWSASSTWTATCELYDPDLDSWSNTGSLATARQDFTATKLSNGKVLVVGGNNSGGTALSTCELYDPGAGTWSATGSMSTARWAHQCITLPNGDILVTGGRSASAGDTFLNSCEIYSVSGGTWSAADSMTDKRYFHFAIALANGDIIVAGGSNVGGVLDSCERYDPTGDSWTTTSDYLYPTTNSYSHTIVLKGGKPRIFGGTQALSTSSNKVISLFKPGPSTWSTADNLTYSRYLGATATVFGDEEDVLVTGGNDSSSILNKCEIYSAVDVSAGNMLLVF